MHSGFTNISSPDTPVSGARKHLRVLIAAGGTGGHVYPAIAIADALRASDPDVKILFVGTKTHMEWRVVPEAGYDIRNIWISGLHRRLTPKNLLFPLKLGTSLIQSLTIINQFKPDVVISCGGYVAGPVGWIAARRGVPLVIQEQNSYPGVTNRLLGKSADRIFMAFEEAKDHFPAEKVRLAGNPVREDLCAIDSREAYRHFDLDPERSTLLVLGGSGGARSINEAMAEGIGELHDQHDLQVIWQCGKKYYDEIQCRIGKNRYKRLRLRDYIDEMDSAYAAADLAVSRAGALSCAELAVTGTPSVLVPSPNVAGDHQTKNAQSMADHGAAVIAPDMELAGTLTELVESLISDQAKLQRMSEAAKEIARPNAARTIAEEILNLAAINTN